jgi:MFS family permease
MRQPPRKVLTAVVKEGRPVHETSGPEPEGDAGLTLSEAVHTKEFWLLFIMFVLFLLSLGLVMLHVIPYAIDSGLSPIAAAGILTFVGIFSLAGRLISGLLSDRIGIKPVILFCLFLEAAIIIWVTFSKDMWVFYTFAALFGIAYSGFVTMMVRITRYVFGPRALGSVFGFLMISDGIGFGVGPWLAGYIFDITGSYLVSLLSVAVGLVAAAVITLVIKPPVRKPE